MQIKVVLFLPFGTTVNTKPVNEYNGQQDGLNTYGFVLIWIASSKVRLPYRILPASTTSYSIILLTLLKD